MESNEVLTQDLNTETQLSESAEQLSDYYEIQSRRYGKILDCCDEVK